LSAGINPVPRLGNTRAKLDGGHFDGGWRRPVAQWRLKAFLNPDPLDLGFVNLTEDDDQFARRQQMLIRDGDQAVPHFALALFARARGEEVVWDDACGELRVGTCGSRSTASR